jgi:DNA primase
MEQQKIERLLEQINIVDIISEYIPLKRYGANHKARCPFHDEKSASFVVSEKKQIFKCFGCGKAGNAITFIKDYEKISYIEAIRKLAEKIGLILNEPVTKTEDSKQTLLYTVYALANTFFQENLREHGKNAFRYLLNRDISEKVMKEFEIGYALNSFNSLYNFLLKQNIGLSVLSESGLFSTGKNGLSDIFHDRIMFPIHNYSGKVVAFGGRIIEEQSNTGKYINSPTTSLYTKGNELYGLHKTRYEISKKKGAIICEGYLDFLRLYEHGFLHTAASLGTALTERQIQLVSRYSEQFILLYDGDTAGQKAAIRAATEIIKQGYSAKIVILPEKEDPDSFLLKFGKSALEELIEEAKDLPDYIKENSGLKLSEKEKLTLLTDLLNEIEKPILRELLINQTADIFRVSSGSLQSQIKQSKKPLIKTDLHIDKHIEERNLLILMLHDADIHKKVALSLNSDYFLSVLYKRIYENLLYQIFGGMKESAILELFDNDEEKELAAKLLWEKKPKTTLDEMIRDIKIRKLKYELALLSKKVISDNEKDTISTEKRKLKEDIRQLAGKKVVQKTLF